jgi:hypothetical protein
MPEVRTEYQCPLCGKDNPGQIIASSGSLVCSVNRSHSWNDTKSFMDNKPVKAFKATPQVFAAQTGHVKVEVLLPLGVKTALENRWAEKLNATVAGVLTMLAEGEVLVVPKTDLQRMKERLGKIPESSGELFGLVYALGEQANDAKQEAEAARKDVAAYEGLNKGSVVVNLGDSFANATEKASAAGQPLKLWMESQFKTALENNWL